MGGSGDPPTGWGQFLIRDPKLRLISAPCFAERVAHHALMNVCEPALDRWLIADTYACRRGKGREAAVLRARAFAGRHSYFLKLDVRKYFDSVPHPRLTGLLARRFKDGRLLDTFGRVVGSFRGGLGRGLPIGSLTSQHLANFYLGWFDRQVKEEWRLPGYARYMDDMALWSDDPARLRSAEGRAADWLGRELGLALKPAYRNRTAAGMDFLGCRVFPDRVTLNRRSRVRLRRKLAGLGRLQAEGGAGAAEAQARATAVLAFATAAGAKSWRTRRSAPGTPADG